MKKTARAAALLVAALALAGCTSAAASTPAPVAVEQAAATASSTEQAWADEKVNQWLGSLGARNFDALEPYMGRIVSHHATKVGTLSLVVGNELAENDEIYEKNLGPANNIWIIGASLMEKVADQSPELKTVTIATEDGKRTETYTRADLEKTRASEAATRP